MNSESMQVYTARITQASKSELVVIIYEIILADLMAARSSYQEGNFNSFDKELKHAQRLLNELIGTLDFKYVISFDLMQLYLYSSKRIVTAIMKRDLATLESVEKVLKSLLVGFEGVSKEDKSGPTMKNTQQLYAGLTYGKGTLTETFLDPREPFRGFKA